MTEQDHEETMIVDITDQEPQNGRQIVERLRSQARIADGIKDRKWYQPPKIGQAYSLVTQWVKDRSEEAARHIEKIEQRLATKDSALKYETARADGLEGQVLELKQGIDDLVERAHTAESTLSSATNRYTTTLTVLGIANFAETIGNILEGTFIEPSATYETIKETLRSHALRPETANNIASNIFTTNLKGRSTNPLFPNVIDRTRLDYAQALYDTVMHDPSATVEDRLKAYAGLHAIRVIRQHALEETDVLPDAAPLPADHLKQFIEEDPTLTRTDYGTLLRIVSRSYVYDEFAPQLFLRTAYELKAREISGMEEQEVKGVMTQRLSKALTLDPTLLPQAVALAEHYAAQEGKEEKVGVVVESIYQTLQTQYKQEGNETLVRNEINYLAQGNESVVKRLRDANLPQLSIALANVVLQVDPEHLDAAYFAGTSAEKLDDPSKAAQYFNRVLELNPTHRWAQKGIARVTPLIEQQYATPETN